jgi:hypothetical protein
MLKFKKASQQEGTLKTIGTVAENAGLGGYHELSSEKNFKGEIKDNGKRTNVTIKVVNSNGDFSYVNCSEAVSKWLRESSSSQEVKERVAQLAMLPILELPQVDRETGEPVMVIDEETGEQVQLVINSISFSGGSDMSATRTVITEDLLKAETVKRAVNWDNLIAI